MWLGYEKHKAQRPLLKRLDRGYACRGKVGARCDCDEVGSIGSAERNMGSFGRSLHESGKRKKTQITESASCARVCKPHVSIAPWTSSSVGSCPAASGVGGGHAILGGMGVVGLVGMRAGGACLGSSQGLRVDPHTRRSSPNKHRAWLVRDDPGCGALRRAPGFCRSPHAACRPRKTRSASLGRA